MIDRRTIGGANTNSKLALDPPLRFRRPVPPSRPAIVHRRCTACDQSLVLHDRGFITCACFRLHPASTSTPKSWRLTRAELRQTRQLKLTPSARGASHGLCEECLETYYPASRPD